MLSITNLVEPSSIDVAPYLSARLAWFSALRLASIASVTSLPKVTAPRVLESMLLFWELITPPFESLVKAARFFK